MIFIIVQISTMIISLKIKLDTYRDIYKKLGDSGYKIDINKVTEIINEKKPNSKLKTITESILFIIPGINIVSATSKRLKETKEFGKKLIDKDAISPMKDFEINAYNHLNSVSKKITFLLYCDTFTQSYEDIGMLLKSESELLEYNIAKLFYEKLPQIAYTLEEVQELSTTINSDYKIGKINGVKTAIIGLPKDVEINEVIINQENILRRYPYESIEEDENSKFVVYPFGFDYEKNEELKDCYNSILEKRDNRRKEYATQIDYNALRNTENNKIYVKKRVK